MAGLFTWFVSCLLVAFLFPSSFFCGRLCSFVYTGAKRKGAIERKRGRGFLGRGLFTRRHRCSLPLGFCFWLCSTGGGESVPDVRWTRCQNKTAGTSPFLLLLPRLCISSFLVLSGWVRRGTDDGVTHCPLWAKFSSSPACPLLFWRERENSFSKTIVLCVLQIHSRPWSNIRMLSLHRRLNW